MFCWAFCCSAAHAGRRTRHGELDDRRHPQAAETLAVSFSAQAAALPIQLLFYGYVPLLALAVNSFAGGLMSLLMLGGIFCMAVGAGLQTVGRWMGRRSERFRARRSA